MADGRTFRSNEQPHPIHAVWELTMRCDHSCSHCGSRAASARPDELSTEELLEVAVALADIGIREVNVIGGEAYLHPGHLDVIEYLAGRGVRVAMQTGGRGLTPKRARRLRDAGLEGVGVSIDGPPDVHDVLRNAPNSYLAAVAALNNARDVGMVTSSNMQVNQLNYTRVRETIERLKPTGIVAWRAQLTAPMGRAADRPEWILEPHLVVEVIDTLAAVQLEIAAEAKEKGIPPKRMLDIQLGNNLGYYGPHEQVLRSRPGREASYWMGCQAGRFTLGIESDGTVKACPSLPTAPYVGGNIRDRSLQELWEGSAEMRFARDRTTEELWGFCKTCMYAEVCKGGCSFTAHTTLGKRGNNPFCYHRVKVQEKRGIRERLVYKEKAKGLPYDFGRFEVVEEPLPEA